MTKLEKKINNERVENYSFELSRFKNFQGMEINQLLKFLINRLSDLEINIRTKKSAN